MHNDQVDNHRDPIVELLLSSECTDDVDGELGGKDIHKYHEECLDCLNF